MGALLLLERGAPCEPCRRVARGLPVRVRRLAGCCRGSCLREQAVAFFLCGTQGMAGAGTLVHGALGGCCGFSKRQLGSGQCRARECCAFVFCRCGLFGLRARCVCSAQLLCMCVKRCLARRQLAAGICLLLLYRSDGGTLALQRGVGCGQTRHAVRVFLPQCRELGLGTLAAGTSSLYRTVLTRCRAALARRVFFQCPALCAQGVKLA